MSESSRGPTARALPPPTDSDGAVSTARLVTPHGDKVPEGLGRPADGDLATFGTAPTLLLTRPANGESANLAAAVPQPVVPEEQPWFRTGATVPPPSMRPPAESVTPAPVRNPPNPRVLKIVGGVIAGCLLIVVVAGVKVLYLRVRGPDATPGPTAQSAPVAPPATLEPRAAVPSPPERATDLGEAARPTAPTAAQPSAPPPVSRTAPTRTSPTPTRTTTKPAVRHAPAPKKVGKSH